MLQAMLLLCTSIVAEPHSLSHTNTKCCVFNAWFATTAVHGCVPLQVVEPVLNPFQQCSHMTLRCGTKPKQAWRRGVCWLKGFRFFLMLHLHIILLSSHMNGLIVLIQINFTGLLQHCWTTRWWSCMLVVSGENLHRMPQDKNKFVFQWNTIFKQHVAVAQSAQ